MIVPYRELLPLVLVPLVLLPSDVELVMFRRSRLRGGRVALYCLIVPSAVPVSSSLRRRGVVSLRGVEVGVAEEVAVEVGSNEVE